MQQRQNDDRQSGWMLTGSVYLEVQVENKRLEFLRQITRLQ